MTEQIPPPIDDTAFNEIKWAARKCLKAEFDEDDERFHTVKEARNIAGGIETIIHALDGSKHKSYLTLYLKQDTNNYVKRYYKNHLDD